MNQLSKDNSAESFDNLYDSIKEVLNKSRQQVYQAVNTSMLFAYWSIGQLIVENEQDGNKNASYGKATLENLSKKLSKVFGAGFTIRNLRNMRKFYLLFQNRHAVRTDLTWTHYRSLLRVENEKARQWHIEETIKEHWLSRQLIVKFQQCIMRDYYLVKIKMKLWLKQMINYRI